MEYRGKGGEEEERLVGLGVRVKKISSDMPDGCSVLRRNDEDGTVVVGAYFICEGDVFPFSYLVNSAETLKEELRDAGLLLSNTNEDEEEDNFVVLMSKR